MNLGPETETIEYKRSTSEMREGDVEAYGTGIPRVRDLCADAGLRIEYARTSWGTKFIFHRNDAFTIVNDNEDVTNGTESDNEDVTNGTERGSLPNSDKTLESMILELLRANPTMTANVLAEETEKSRRQVLRVLASMQDVGKLERIGPNRGGRWHVLS